MHSLHEYVRLSVIQSSLGDNNNTIYACNAPELLNYATDNNLNIEAMISIYYPYLYQRNIKSLENYNKSYKRQQLFSGLK